MTAFLCKACSMARTTQIRGIVRRAAFRLWGTQELVILVRHLSGQGRPAAVDGDALGGDLSFREATPGDLDDLVREIPRSLVNYQRPAALREALRTELAGGAWNLLAVRGGQPVAGVWLPPPVPFLSEVPALAPLLEPPVHMVMRFFVASSERGRGLGRRLLGEAMVRAATGGIRTVVSLIAHDNAASLRVHLGNGFRRVAVARTRCCLGRRDVRYLADSGQDAGVAQPGPGARP